MAALRVVLFSLVVLVLGGVITFLTLNGTGTFTFFTAQRSNVTSTNQTTTATQQSLSGVPQTAVPLKQTHLVAHEDKDGRGLCVQYTADGQSMNLLSGTSSSCPTGPLTPPPYDYEVLYDTCDHIPNKNLPPFCTCRGSLPSLDLQPYCTVI